MNGRSVRIVAGLFACLFLSASGATAAGPESSLDKCQTKVAGATTKYVTDVTKAVSPCLDAISNAVIAKGMSPSAAASATAKACVSKLRLLRNTSKPEAQLDRRLRAKIVSSCDPAVNPRLLHAQSSIWTVGTTTLSAANLADYCRAAGGSGSLSSLDDWTSCLVAVADCQTRQAVALRWPRALEYLAALEPALAALPTTPEASDALAAARALDSALEGTTDDQIPELACAPSSTGLLATGQTQCDRGDGTFGACPGAETGEDGEVRAGAPHRFTDNGDGTITDHMTGLMWEKSSRDLGPNDPERAALNWYTAGLEILRTRPDNGFPYPANLGGLGGYDDWRAPNRRELESLVDLGRHDPAIDPVFHHDCTPGCTLEQCACTTSDLHWTASPADETNVWAVSFADGSVVPVAKYQKLRVRGVRGGTPHFPIPHGAPYAVTTDVQNPWKQECIPITLTGIDVDGSCAIGAEIVSFPQNGFLATFVGDQAVDDCRDPVGEYMMAGQGHHRYTTTLCYVTFGTAFTGTDSFQFRVVDRQGNVSDPAIVTITVFEL